MNTSKFFISVVSVITLAGGAAHADFYCKSRDGYLSLDVEKINTPNPPGGHDPVNNPTVDTKVTYKNPGQDFLFYGLQKIEKSSPMYIEYSYNLRGDGGPDALLQVSRADFIGRGAGHSVEINAKLTMQGFVNYFKCSGN